MYILKTSANYPNVMNVENEIHLPQTLHLEKLVNRNSWFLARLSILNFSSFLMCILKTPNYPNVMNVENEIHLPQTLQLEKSLNRITVAGL